MTPPDPATPSPLEALLKDVDAGPNDPRLLLRYADGIPMRPDLWLLEGLEDGNTESGIHLATFPHLVPEKCGIQADAILRMVRSYTAAPRLAAIVRVLRDALVEIRDSRGDVSEYVVSMVAIDRADEIAEGKA